MNAPSKTSSLQEIERGELTHRNGEKFAFKVVHGWDAKASLECDVMWKQSWLALFQQIEQAESDLAKQREILGGSHLNRDRTQWVNNRGSQGHQGQCRRKLRLQEIFLALRSGHGP